MQRSRFRKKKIIQKLLSELNLNIPFRQICNVMWKYFNMYQKKAELDEFENEESFYEIL